jgi:hypothetical protein
MQLNTRNVLAYESYSCTHPVQQKDLQINLHGGFLQIITIFVNLGLFRHFDTVYKYKNMDKITQILENVVRCKYFEAGVHIKNPL